MKIKNTILILMLFCLTSGLAAQDGVGRGLFESEEIFDIVLNYDIKKLSKDRGESRDYHPAKLSYTGADGNIVTLDVRLKVRGRLRRQMLKCLVPPFKIKFDPKQTPGTLFAGQDTLKIVTHCKNKPKFFQHYTLQEYLVYKIYNVLTDLSFRVRMVNFVYTGSGGKTKFNAHGFFIEDIDALTARHNAKKHKIPEILPHKADFSTSTLAAVFEYMIGNTDWSIRSSHNMRLVTIGDNPLYFPIPFDFDQCGLVDAHYARPDLALTIRSVRERLYRGFCQDPVQFEKTFKVFRDNKEKILAIFRDAEFLPKNIKKKNIKYLEGFYKIIDNPKLVKRYFIDNYRGRPFPKR